MKLFNITLAGCRRCHVTFLSSSKAGDKPSLVICIDITILVIWYVLFREEIDYIMMCVDANQDGKVDFLEFTERFHNPAKDIGFNVALLLTNLAEHMPNDPRSVMGPGSKLPDGS